MTRPRAASPREVLDRAFTAAVQHGPAAFADLFAVDGTLEYPFAPNGIPRRLRGREQVRAHLAGRQSATLLRFQAHRATAVYQTDDPDVIVAELELRGTVVATGRPVVLPSIAVLRVCNGEIVSYRDYYHPLAPAEATGRLPELFAMLAGEQST
jgi:ketosteroid isomerase-like protein